MENYLKQNRLLAVIIILLSLLLGYQYASVHRLEDERNALSGALERVQIELNESGRMCKKKLDALRGGPIEDPMNPTLPEPETIIEFGRRIPGTPYTLQLNLGERSQMLGLGLDF